MIFLYPQDAITTKSIDRFTYRTYAMMGVNMNKYNNDSSNTFYLLDTAAIEFDSVLYDLNYQFNPSLMNVDFVTIDRINRFDVKKLGSKISYDISSGIVSCEDEILGWSIYTNRSYTLLNVNKLTDFTRHSYPKGFFLETGYHIEPGSTINNPSTVSLAPNVKTIFNTPILVKNSKITISITDGDIKELLVVTPPSIFIEGHDPHYNKVKEEVLLTNIHDIITSNEYTEINSMLIIGVSGEVNIMIEPYVKKRTAALDWNYVDRDEQYEFPAVFSLDKQNKKLIINRVDDTFAYPPLLDPYDSIDMWLPDGYYIDDYMFDEQNKLLYIITRLIDDPSSPENINIRVFPLIIPFTRDNISVLGNTQQQNVKVSYTRDGILRKYILTFQPAQRAHGVDALDVSIKHSFGRELGNWTQWEYYSPGDLVVYAGTEYICNADGSASQEYFNIDEWTPRVEYLVEGMVLDLLTYGIERNTIEVSFDKIFAKGEEAILQVETTGFENCRFEILCQNHPLKRIVSTSIYSLWQYIDLQAQEVPAYCMAPIKNDSNLLLSDKINGYNNVPANLMPDAPLLYKLSSTNKIYINGDILTPVFDTFYLDWQNSSVITSDTITHLVI